MTVLHVIASMDPQQGGVSQAVKTMIAGLDHEHINNEIVSLDAPGQEFLKEQSFPVTHTVGPAKGPWCYSNDLSPWLIKNFSRFDAVVVHGLWLYPGYAVRRALKQHARQHTKSAGTNYKIPRLFVMPHGMLDPYFQQASGRKLKALRNNLYWRLVESKTINRAEKILFTTEEERVLAKKTFTPYKPKAEAIVGLGVDEPPAFSTILKKAFTQKCPAIGNSRYLLFLSRIHEKKGLDLLLSAYAHILQKNGKGNLETSGNTFPKLIVAGPGFETMYGEKIQAMVSSSPILSQHVILTGMLTGDAKWGAFYGCETFILPSHQENFGIAVVEALACQKPVLISDNVNIWREIKATGSGIVCRADLEGVVKLLESWFKLSSKEQLLMGKNSRTLFQNSFAVEAAAKQLTAALQQHNNICHR